MNQISEDPPLLKVLQVTTITALAFISGLSFCLSAWIIPIILKSPSDRTRITQFTLMVSKGFTYLQPSSRILAVSLLSLASLIFRHSNAAVAARWRYWAAAIAVLVPVAPYESFAIFPINDRIKELEGQLGNQELDQLPTRERKELEDLLKTWQRRNIGRVLIPLAASLAGLWGMVGMP